MFPVTKAIDWPSGDRATPPMPRIGDVLTGMLSYSDSSRVSNTPSTSVTTRVPSGEMAMSPGTWGVSITSRATPPPLGGVLPQRAMRAPTKRTAARPATAIGRARRLPDSCDSGSSTS